MSDVNVNLKDVYAIDLKKPENSQSGDVGSVDTLYTSIFLEQDRTTFSESFSPTSFEDAPQGAKFCNSLVDNQEDLMSRMGISEDEYNYYASVALALASQETGMGFEEDFVSENEGFGGFKRSAGKLLLGIFGGDSASSGLTQMKIYEFMKGDLLTQEQKDILNDYGVNVSHKGKNNLYSNPDLSAVATMVVLHGIQSKIDDYHIELANAHATLGFELKDGLSEEERIKQGEELLTSVIESYNAAPHENQDDIRHALKEWFMAENGSKISKNMDKKYNEEYQLQTLNELTGLNLKQDDLNYLRYYLSSSGQHMDRTESLAYFWNKGYTEDSTKPDRMYAYKSGTLMFSPDDLSYDQFPVNVAKFAQLYYTDMYDG